MTKIFCLWKVAYHFYICLKWLGTRSHAACLLRKEDMGEASFKSLIKLDQDPYLKNKVWTAMQQNFGGFFSRKKFREKKINRLRFCIRRFLFQFEIPPMKRFK